MADTSGSGTSHIYYTWKNFSKKVSLIAYNLSNKAMMSCMLCVSSIFLTSRTQPYDPGGPPIGLPDLTIFRNSMGVCVKSSVFVTHVATEKMNNISIYRYFRNYTPSSFRWRLRQFKHQMFHLPNLMQMSKSFFFLFICIRFGA